MALLGGTLAQLSADKNISLSELQKLNPQANLNTTYSVSELKFPTVTAPAPVSAPTLAPAPISTVDSRPASQLTKEEYAARAGVDVSRVQGTPGNYVIGPAPTAVSQTFQVESKTYTQPPAQLAPPAPSGQAGVVQQQQQQNNQAIINQINEQGNADQDAALNAILSQFGKVDTSKSTEISDKILSKIGEVFNAPAIEKPKSLSELFASKKTELGVDKLETDLAGIDSQIQKLDAGFASSIELEEGKLVSTREITRNIGQNEIAYNRRRRDLLVEKSTISNQLTNKMNTLEMVMNFTQQDFTNASNFYNQQFTKSMSMLNLVLNLEEKAQSRQDRARNEAQSNLNTIYNLFDKQNIKFDSLSDSQKAVISKLELSAGLPQGISALIAKSSPNQEIKATTSRTDAKGNVYYDVLTVDPKTGAMTVKNIFRGTETVKGTDTDTDIIKDFNKDVTSWNKEGTREQFIRQLQARFPKVDPGDIARKVYEVYPDGYDE